MDGYQCARCGLPLYVSNISEEDRRPRLWHVHARSQEDAGGKVVLDLKVRGRDGCEQPRTLHPGIPYGEDSRKPHQAPSKGS